MTKKKEIVVKSNSLIEAAYTLSVAEQNVILAAIAQIDRSSKVTDEHVYSVTANALADIVGFKAKNEYRILRDIAKRLWNRTLVIHDEGKERWIRWVQECIYIKSEGRIEIRFSKAILPYLCELQRCFTQYERRFVMKMKSKYSIRIYELLVQWRRKGEREVEIRWLREILRLEDKYKSIRDFKRFVINAAIDDINKHSDIQVEVGYRKAGRVVAYIQFKFRPKSKAKSSVAKTKTAAALEQLTERKLISMAAPGETWDQLAEKAIRNGYTARDVYSIVNKLKRQR